MLTDGVDRLRVVDTDGFDSYSGLFEGKFGKHGRVSAERNIGQVPT